MRKNVVCLYENSYLMSFCLFPQRSVTVKAEVTLTLPIANANGCILVGFPENNEIKANIQIDKKDVQSRFSYFNHHQGISAAMKIQIVFVP